MELGVQVGRGGGHTLRTPTLPTNKLATRGMEHVFLV